MERSVDEQVAALLAKRKAVATGRKTKGQDVILQALDDMIVELETGRWPNSLAPDE